MRRLIKKTKEKSNHMKNNLLKVPSAGRRDPEILSDICSLCQTQSFALDLLEKFHRLFDLSNQKTTFIFFFIWESVCSNLAQN